MYEKWYTNVFGVISLRGPPRGPTFFLAPPEKMLKSTVFELEQWFLHQNGPFFHQEFNGKGLWVLGSQFCTKKLKNISEFQNSWNFWIFGSWTQPGAWHMIVPFWSWNLSDTTHVRPHTKFQLVWAINTVFTRGGHNVPPPSLKCVAGTPSLLGLTFSYLLLLNFVRNGPMEIDVKNWFSLAKILSMEQYRGCWTNVCWPMMRWRWGESLREKSIVGILSHSC